MLEGNPPKKVYEPIGSMQLFRLTNVIKAFTCARCQRQKGGTLVAIKDGDWSDLYCNACHGLLAEEYRK